MVWLNDGSESVLHFERCDGWKVFMNLNDTPVQMPVHSEILYSSEPLTVDGFIPGNTTVWYKS